MLADETKSFKVELPIDIWEDFFRLYPGRGERTTLIRRVICKLIERYEDFDSFTDRIVDEVEDE